MPEPLPAWLAPLLLPEELRASDAYAIDTCEIPGIVLMERAGAALADAAMRRLPAGRIVVVCGPGNNGGDGLVAARILHQGGREVRLCCTRNPAGYRGDAALAAQQLGGVIAVDPVEGLAGALRGAAGAIDAILGTGAVGAPTGAEAHAIAALAEAGIPVIACDVPSGLDAATGERAVPAVQAALTVTFHRPSPGHLIHPGKGAVGTLVIADIGIPAGAPITPQAGAVRAAVLQELPRRGSRSHKYTAGHVLAVAGSDAYPGAAVLTVRGAQRAGAGYVTALASARCLPALMQWAPEAVVVERGRGSSASELHHLLGRASAAVAGPGLADEAARPIVDALLRSPLPLVLDADGLTRAAGGEPERLRRRAPLILTPHAGELAQLLGCASAEVQAQRLRHARELAERADAVVVLKGDDTLVVAPDGTLAVHDLAAPALATAGTGDVLAGAMSALLAAGTPPLLAACGAVRVHAQAGRLAAARAGSTEGVVAIDVAEALPAARGGAGN